jgi:hypothetical protein
MARTLRDDMAGEIYSTLLNEAEAAEWITYYPGGGGDSRRMLALVTEQSAVEQGEVIELEKELLSVVVGGDPSHAKGGVTRPSRDLVSVGRSDTLLRESDTDTTRFVFTGIARRMQGGWVMQFERPRKSAYLR